MFNTLAKMIRIKLRKGTKKFKEVISVVHSPVRHVLPVPLDAEDEVDHVEHVVEVLNAKTTRSGCSRSVGAHCMSLKTASNPFNH